MNVMVAVGYTRRIYAMNASEPGCRHDVHVFKKSGFYKKLMNDNYCPFKGAQGVGDSAYQVSVIR